MTPKHQRPTEPLNAFDPDTHKKCRFCQKIFKPTRPWQDFCCPAHRSSYWNIQYILNKKESNDK